VYCPGGEQEEKDYKQEDGHQQDHGHWPEHRVNQAQ
jgi:hypothetical protein